MRKYRDLFEGESNENPFKPLKIDHTLSKKVKLLLYGFIVVPFCLFPCDLFIVFVRTKFVFVRTICCRESLSVQQKHRKDSENGKHESESRI